MTVKVSLNKSMKFYVGNDDDLLEPVKGVDNFTILVKKLLRAYFKEQQLNDYSLDSNVCRDINLETKAHTKKMYNLIESLEVQISKGSIQDLQEINISIHRLKLIIEELINVSPKQVVNGKM